MDRRLISVIVALVAVLVAFLLIVCLHPWCCLPSRHKARELIGCFPPNPSEVLPAFAGGAVPTML